MGFLMKAGNQQNQPQDPFLSIEFIITRRRSLLRIDYRLTNARVSFKTLKVYDVVRSGKSVFRNIAQNSIAQRERLATLNK